MRTRETYGRSAAMFAVWAGDERAVMRPDKARDFLSWKVTEQKVSFATQKQGLNALVFFFKAVCGMAEVDLEVRLRKTEPRLPVVLEVKEVLAVLDKIEGQSWDVLRQRPKIGKLERVGLLVKALWASV